MVARTLENNSRWKSSTRLDWEKVAEIRMLALEGKTQASIAERFGVSKGHVQSIVAGTKWRSKVA
jgi:DNA-directed RNA polymerase specialized sigma24 family protein